MNTSTRSTVLVTGGTGRQGGATVHQLLQAGRVRVRVLTRDPSGKRARQLASRGAELVRGDFDDARALAHALEGVTAAFSVQGFMDQGVAREVQWGRAMADAVKAVGGVHLVYSSVDGAERSSGVPHFDSKWQAACKTLPRGWRRANGTGRRWSRCSPPVPASVSTRLARSANACRARFRGRKRLLRRSRQRHPAADDEVAQRRLGRWVVAALGSLGIVDLPRQHGDSLI